MKNQQPPPYSANPYPPGPVPVGSAPIVMQPTIVTAIALGPESQNITCPSCHAIIRTKVKSEANSRTHLFALIMCLFVCWPCCLLPYCMDSCQSTNHYCPNCSAFLGSYDP